jgi:hypothetical protein
MPKLATAERSGADRFVPAPRYQKGRAFVEDSALHPLHIGAAIEVSPDWALLPDGRQKPDIIARGKALSFFFRVRLGMSIP